MGRAVGVFGLGTVGISFAAIFVRLALPAPPVVTAFYRLLFASGALLLWLIARGALRRPEGGLLPAALAGVCFGADLSLWHTSIVHTSVANATLLVNTTPLFVGAFAILAWREGPDARFVGGAALAIAGVAVLLGGDLGRRTEVVGDALALAAALFYSSYLLLMKVVRRAMDAIPAVAIAGVAATVTVGAVAWARGDAFRGFPAHSWWAFAGAAGISQLAGVLGIVWALRHLRATFASVALLAQPVGTALLGWWILGEGLSHLQVAGGALALAGIALASGAAVDAPPGSSGSGA